MDILIFPSKNQHSFNWLFSQNSQSLTKNFLVFFKNLLTFKEVKLIIILRLFSVKLEIEKIKIAA